MLQAALPQRPVNQEKIHFLLKNAFFETDTVNLAFELRWHSLGLSINGKENHNSLSASLEIFFSTLVPLCLSTCSAHSYGVKQRGPFNCVDLEAQLSVQASGLAANLTGLPLGAQKHASAYQIHSALEESDFAPISNSSLKGSRCECVHPSGLGRPPTKAASHLAAESVARTEAFAAWSRRAPPAVITPVSPYISASLAHERNMGYVMIKIPTMLCTIC